MKRRTVGILVFPDIEVLDFCGPFEVFSLARLDPDTRREEPFVVSLVAATLDPVRATGGLRVLPDFGTDNCPPIDILVVPGGSGTRPLLADTKMIDWVRSRAGVAELVTSVCTGALLLGRAGLLDGKRSTTHWLALDLLEQSFPATRVVRDEHVVTDGTLVTSAGISAGIDMALLVVARLCGDTVARQTAEYMEYRFTADNRRRVDVPPAERPTNMS